MKKDNFQQVINFDLHLLFYTLLLILAIYRVSHTQATPDNSGQVKVFGNIKMTQASLE